MFFNSSSVFCWNSSRSARMSSWRFLLFLSSSFARCNFCLSTSSSYLRKPAGNMQKRPCPEAARVALSLTGVKHGDSLGDNLLKWKLFSRYSFFHLTKAHTCVEALDYFFFKFVFATRWLQGSLFVFYITFEPSLFPDKNNTTLHNVSAHACLFSSDNTVKLSFNRVISLIL